MPPPPVPLSLLGPFLSLAAITVAIGVFAGPVFALARRAAEQLGDPAQYVPAVLGGAALILVNVLLALAWIALAGDWSSARSCFALRPRLAPPAARPPARRRGLPARRRAPAWASSSTS